MIVKAGWQLVLALCLGASACGVQSQSVLAPKADSAPPLSTAQASKRFSGRIAVHYQQDGKNEHMNGSFQWQQQPDETRIELSSPTGQVLAEIIVTASGASLTQAGKESRSAASIDELTSELLGWPLPVAGMRDWLQGQGYDAKGARFVANSATDTLTSNDGWRIRYASWHDHTHPKRIDLERHIDSQGGDVSLRIVLDAPNE